MNTPEKTQRTKHRHSNSLIMNKNAVISNMATNEKLGTSSHRFKPMASICDPEYLFTLPAMQTAAGTADIMSHVIENYFKSEKGAFVQDRISEGILETCIKYCPIALKDSNNYGLVEPEA